MKKKRHVDKFYTHFDLKKKYVNYEHKVKDPRFVISHGFFPFIHFQIKHKKYTLNHKTGKKEIVPKTRNIKYASHIDRLIYQHYGELVNCFYNKAAKKYGVNRVATAYRNNFTGKSNIHFAKEVFEFIAKQEKAYIFLGDFSDFFDNLEHTYLKERLKDVLSVKSLPKDHYAVFKNVTKYSYIRLTDIANYKKITMKKLRESKVERYFNTKDFQIAKKCYLSKNDKEYGIPQGSSISSVYSNVYMLEFDRDVNAYVTARKGLYRRYCDDFIIVIPDNNHDHFDFILKKTKEIPKLDLQPDKTEQYFYDSHSEKRIKALNKRQNHFNYLGFYFDGKMVKIRDKSLFKYYSRAYKKAKVVLRAEDKQKKKIIQRKLFRLYTYIGDNQGKKKGKDKYGNFITYARKAHTVFSESSLLDSSINKQVKRHWRKISNIFKKSAET